ncbi:MAG: methyl-accepting chemotaxis protein, partial [Planctomycetes bacterium]|nr:methyl-accepting chemotaxis protein [Planctomycetota bacterium]
AGRGFAVVAEEVRGLAQRAATAAREIGSLIAASVQQVETGSRLVDQAGCTIQEVVTKVGDVSGLVAGITEATIGQSQGIEQVHTAVTQLDQATQQNAALVEESAAVATSLREQAQQLATAIGVFRVAD